MTNSELDGIPSQPSAAVKTIGFIGRQWPFFRGTTRIRDIVKALTARDRGLLLTRLANSNLELAVPVGEHVGTSLLAFGEIDKDLVSFVKQFLTGHAPSGSIFVDIGSNIGAIVLRAASYGCQCVAFEPQLELANIINWNARHNELDQLIRVRNIALGTQEGTLVLSASGDNCGNVRTSYSGDGVEVPVSTIALEFSHEEWSKVSMVKIDVEGFELEVLRGGKELFAKHRPLIVSEVNSYELSRMDNSWATLRNLLTDLGYTTFHALGPRLYPIKNGVHPVWNVVATTEAHQDALTQIGIDSSYRPRSYPHFPVSRYGEDGG